MRDASGFAVEVGLMRIRLYPEPVLRETCTPVETFDQGLAVLASGMVRAMHENRGLGLAGPQVGVTQCVAIVSPDGEAGHETVLVNPEIVRSEGKDEHDEGCLSFPGIYVRVRRAEHVVVRYQDVGGAAHEMEAWGLLARAILHELDHLDGRLLVDRMSPVQRVAQRRRLRQLEERYDRRSQEVEMSSEAADEG